MSGPTPLTYKTRNWPAYSEALKRRGSLTIWLDPAMTWDATPTGKRRRQPVYGDAAIQTCLTMKVLFGMALRQTTGFVESLLSLIGLDWAVPDFNTLSRRQKTLKVNIPYRGSDGPLHLLVDSTGIKVEGEGEWNARKHGGTERRVWRKIHIGIDEKSLEIRAAEFTTRALGDAPMLPELLDQIPAEQEIATVTADGAFDTRKCHDATAARGAAAIIPPRKNAKPWKPDAFLAVGGGSAIDAAKAIAVLVSNGGDIFDYEGIDRIPRPIPPMIAAPTTAGTGADVSQFAVITDTERGEKMLIAGLDRQAAALRQWQRRATHPDAGAVASDVRLTPRELSVLTLVADGLTAAAVARRLAEGPTAAYAAIKESLAYGAGHSLAETLGKEDELQGRAGASEDHAIAVEAFVKKEKPVFLGH